MTVRDRAQKTYGVYVHIPYCKAKCAYCAFVSGCDFSSQKQYVSALRREISGLREKDITADTVYIGGGTPSCLYRGAIEEIMSALRGSITVTENAEITVEANPESCGASFVDEIKFAGVNRVSIGLQSANDGILSKIGRIHTLSDFFAAVGLLHRRGFDNVSSDIILGLPDESEKDVTDEIGILTDMCSHISMYALTVEENTPLQKSGYSPDDDRVADMYDIACGMLDKSGFKRYEVSNFARDGRESRHNRKYWSMQPYIGIGAAAHGYDGSRTRYRHTDDVSKYIAGEKTVEVALSDKDVYNEYIMLALRTERGIDERDFLTRFGYSFAERNSQTLELYEKHGHIVRQGGFIHISPDKMFVMNGIIEDFMLD